MLRTFVLLLCLTTVLVGCESRLVREVAYFERIGDLPAAQARLETAVRSNPSDPEARFTLGRILIEQDAFAAGREHFEVASKLTARFDERITYILEYNFREQVEAGQLQLDANAWPDAVTYFANATDLKPADPLGFRMLGHALVKNHRFADASSAYLAAVELVQEDAGSWRNLAELAFAQQQFPEAVGYGEAALALDEQHEPTRRRLAHSLLNAGRSEEAISHYQNLASSSGEIGDLRNLAYILFNQEAYEAARGPLEQVVADAPDDKALRTLSEVYYQLEAFREAIEVNALLLNQDEMDRAALASQVKAYEGLGDLEMAREFRDRLRKIKGEVQ